MKVLVQKRFADSYLAICRALPILLTIGIVLPRRTKKSDVVHLCTSANLWPVWKHFRLSEVLG
jgi:hypothetical protein